VLLRDGVRLIVLVDPLGQGAAPAADGPGAVVTAGDVAPSDGRERRQLVVENTSTRVVRVSSHFPFDRVNRRLVFDRAAAAGYRLDIEAGSSERWSPGETRAVTLVRFGGEAGADRGRQAGPEPGTEA
jgi:urease beta subunit